MEDIISKYVHIKWKELSSKIDNWMFNTIPEIKEKWYIVSNLLKENYTLTIWKDHHFLIRNSDWEIISHMEEYYKYTQK